MTEDFDVFCKIRHGKDQSVAICEDVKAKKHVYNVMIVGKGAKDTVGSNLNSFIENFLKDKKVKKEYF